MADRPNLDSTYFKVITSYKKNWFSFTDKKVYKLPAVKLN